LKKILLFPYYLVRWIIFIFLFLVILVLFLLENPSVALKFAKEPLKEQNITYQTIEGGLFTGFRLTKFNYQNKVKAKEVALDIDWKKLDKRVLYIKDIELKDIEIQKEYLQSLIDSNSTEEDDSNSSLPFDRVVVENADISLTGIEYDKYTLNSGSIKIKNFTTDMKKEYRGDIDLDIDSNVAMMSLSSHIHDDKFKLVSDIEPQREFLKPYLKDNNITLPNNPKFKIKADGSLEEINYYIDTKRLEIEQNGYSIESKKLLLSGSYNIPKKDIKAELDTNLDGNMAHLKLKGSSSLNLDDINNTLKFDIATNLLADKGFVSSQVSDKNITINKIAPINLKAKGDLKKLFFDMNTQNLEIEQNRMLFDIESLIVGGNYSVVKKDVNVNLDTKIDGNVAHLVLKGDSSLNLDDINSTLKFNIDTNLLADRDFVNSKVSDKNITIKKLSPINLKAKGDFQKLFFNIDTQNLKAKQNEMLFSIQSLLLNGDYSISKKDVNIDIDTKIDGNVAHLVLKEDSSLNLDDINNSLRFNVDANLLPYREFVESQIPDKNISIKKVAPIDLKANGTLKKALFDIGFSGLDVRYNKLYLKVPSMLLKGESSPLDGNTSFDIATDLISSAGDGHIDDSIFLNFYDINKTLKYKAKIDINAKSEYINTFLKDTNITIINRPKVNISLNGNLQKITIQTKAKADVKKEKIISNVILDTTPITFDGINHQVDGALKLSSNSKAMKFDIDSKFQGDYTNPKKLNLNTKAKVDRFNDFGINLNPLTPIVLDIQNDKNGARAKIDSKRVKLNAKSKDYDNIVFDIKTGNLYLYKIIELPSELDHKYLKLDIKGGATISKKYIDAKGYIYSNKKFKAKLDIHNNKSGLNAKIATQHLVLKAKGNIDKKDIKAQVDIDSLKELQKEITKVYPFNKFDIDGGLRLNAKLKGERAWAELSSKELKLNGFSIKKLDIDADYNKNLITLNKFSFNTTGFKDKKFNKSIYLNKKGKIYLGEKKLIDIDLHPNIRITANGDNNILDAKVTMYKFPLAHPDYGSMFVSTNIDYKQRGEDKTILGDITIKKLKLFYEPKFLDIDYDPDVVVITKKDKNKKSITQDDSFLKHTKIDIAIKAPQANYKTPDIDLTFDVDVRAYKEFGKELSMLGKIKDINGHFDQIPKRFEIENSNIIFKGGKKINPLLDIKVKYTLPQVVIYIDIGGDANRPKLEFSSEPPMPKKDIMSYLLFGVSTKNLKSDGSLGREAELFIINQAARDLAYEFDLDRVFVKDDGTGEGYAIEVGKKVGNKNMIIIESSKEGNSYILEHDMSKNIKLRVGQHQKEHPSQSIDIFFRKRFK